MKRFPALRTAFLVVAVICFTVAWGIVTGWPGDHTWVEHYPWAYAGGGFFSAAFLL